VRLNARSRPIFSAGFPGAEKPHHSRPEIAISLAVLVAGYLLVVEAVKRLFHRHMTAARGTAFPARA
jgi:hypothetical protein